MISMSFQNGAMIGGEDRALKSVIVAVVYDLPNDSTPFVFTYDSPDVLCIIFVCLLHIESINKSSYTIYNLNEYLKKKYGKFDCFRWGLKPVMPVQQWKY